MKTPERVVEFSTQWKKMIESAEKEGIIFVTSAGNDVGTVILTRLSASYGLTI